MTDLDGSRKRAGLIDIPDDTVAIIHGYQTNSGLRYILAYAPENEMPELQSWYIHQNDSLSQLPTLYLGDARDWAIEFLWS